MSHTRISGADDLDGHLRWIDTEFRPALAAAAAHSPVVVGEWCLNTSAERHGRRPAHPTGLLSTPRRGSTETPGKLPSAGFYWSYKLQVSGPERDGWDFGKSVALDHLTTEHLAPQS